MRKDRRRYEYHGGEIFAMAGGDPVHSLISGNIIFLLNTALAKRGCRVFNSDLKLPRRRAR
ncbi:MAG: Uma2 family endonuclease [Catalinimonas sp.]